MANKLRIAHLSDIHFFDFNKSPLQFFSKRWIGNWNFQLFRKRHYSTDHLHTLPSFLQSLSTRYLFITGDFTSTSLSSEFNSAKKLYDEFLKQGIDTFALPGNHDVYTRASAQNKTYYSYFPSEKLRSDRVECIQLEQRFWYLAIDCAISTPHFCAYGSFLEQIEKAMQQSLKKIPTEDTVIVACHFPLFSTGRSLHDLHRAEKLQELLQQFRQVKLYLHGHDHGAYIIDHQKEGYPLVINSGSCAKKSEPAFNILDLSNEECLVKRYVLQNGRWSFVEEKCYPWQRN